MSTETEICRVVRVSFERDDHGILTCSIPIKFAGSGQSYGGYALDGPGPNHTRKPSLFAGLALLRIVDFFGGNLDSAAGTVVVVTRESGLIRRIARLDVDGGAVLDFRAMAEETKP